MGIKQTRSVATIYCGKNDQSLFYECPNSAFGLRQ